MTFFNFQNTTDIPSAVFPDFWLLWAVTVPITLLVVEIVGIAEIRKEWRSIIERTQI